MSQFGRGLFFKKIDGCRRLFLFMHLHYFQKDVHPVIFPGEILSPPGHNYPPKGLRFTLENIVVDGQKADENRAENTGARGREEPADIGKYSGLRSGHRKRNGCHVCKKCLQPSVNRVRDDAIDPGILVDSISLHVIGTGGGTFFLDAASFAGNLEPTSRQERRAAVRNGVSSEAFFLKCQDGFPVLDRTFGESHAF